MTEPTMTVRTWILPASAEERATERLDKVNKRITRAGLTPYVYAFTPADPLPEFDDRHATGSTTHDGIQWPTLPGGDLCRLVCWHERVTLTVTGEVPHFEGWDFVATIVRDDFAGTMTRVVPGLDVNLDALRDRDASECDHCNLRRDRNKVYAVRNTETGQILQVGSTCLASFLGIAVSIADVAYDNDLDAELSGMGGGGFGAGDRAYTPADVLAVAFHVVAKHGWVPQSRSYAGVPTGAAVRNLLNPPPRDRVAVEASRAMWAALSDDDRRHGAAALEYARTLDVTSPRSNEYEKNLRAVALGVRVSVSNVGLLASAISGYNRHVERVLADAIPRKPSEHQGVEGEKWLFRALTVTRVDPLETAVAWRTTVTTYRVKFIDPAGNRFAWYATRFDHEPGAVLDVTGTVKKHDTYTPEPRDGQPAKAQRETQLTRCTVVESAEGQPLEHTPAPTGKRAGKRAATKVVPAQYVVTFDPRPVAGPGAIEGLRRMTLTEARDTLTVAGRIPKHGRIVDANTLATVEEADAPAEPTPVRGEGKIGPAAPTPVDLDVRACDSDTGVLDEWEALAASL